MNWIRIVAWLGLAALVLGALSWWTSSIETRGYDRGRSEVQALRDQDATARAREDTRRALNQVRQSEDARELENRREAAKEKEIAHARHEQRLAQDAAARADGAAGRLRDQVAFFVADARARAAAGAAADPQLAQRSEAAASPLVVLADLLGRADAVAGELAKAVDAARAAGLSCERSADALRP